MKPLVLAVLVFVAPPVWAEILVPVRTIRAREIVAAEDLVVKSADVSGALSDPGQVVGLEARAVLYPGRPIRPGDVGTPAIIDRNDLVTLIYSQGGLRIETEGRALGRGGAGEMVRVLNSASRTTITGRIRADGRIEVR